MVSGAQILACTLLSLVLWAGPGWLFAPAISRQPAVRILLAPALGWAVQSVVALAVAQGVGLSRLSIILATLGVSLIPVVAAVRGAAAPARSPPRRGLPSLVIGLAALLALVPLAAVLPKAAADGAVALAAPIYDHAKVALIDEMVLHGVPPGNPFYGAGGAAGRVAYYYLWHFGAAQLAVLAGASGWATDAAATAFTAFAAFCLVAGLARRFYPGPAAPLLALAVVAAGSLRPVLASVFGTEPVDRILEPASGLGGILFQGSWSPHHVAAACCVVLAAQLLARLRERTTLAGVLLLGVLAAAGFQSSLWVGGVTFALAGGATALALAISGPREGRWPYLLGLAGAALLALLLVVPLLAAQLAEAGARGGGFPVRVTPFAVLGPLVPGTVKSVLDIPAYWLVLLPLDFPLLLAFGSTGLAMVLRRGDGRAHRCAMACACMALGAFVISAGLASTAGENNDLGWRAALPAILILTGSAGAALAQLVARKRRAALAGALLLLVLALPDSLVLAARNVTGEASIDGRDFAQDPAMWAAVRDQVPADGRLASNPDRLDELVPWPINLSWALLAQRRSCFAGPELALAFAPLRREAREAASDLFARVFGGAPAAGDLEALRLRFGCAAVLVTSRDEAWSRDPFADAPGFRLAREEPGRWRLYLVRQSAIRAD